MNRLRLWLMVLCGAAAAFPVRAQYGFQSFADLAEKLIPTVVNISTIQQPDQINIPAEGSNGGGEYYDPLEGRVALGSGFIISEDGYIITNYHVIENAEVVNVVLLDNTEVEADIIGGDEKTAIAAYHAGRGQVNAWLRDPDISPDGKTLVNIPESETKKYVEKVQMAVSIYDKLYKKELNKI